MTSIVMRSAAVAGVAVLVSLGGILAIGFLAKDLIGLDSWIIGTVCPLLIAGPTSAYMFAQGDRLKAASGACPHPCPAGRRPQAPVAQGQS